MYATMIKIMWRIKKSDRLIMMGELVPYFMTFHMRRSLTLTDRILYPLEGRYMLKSNINLGSLFNFQMKILMK